MQDQHFDLAGWFGVELPLFVLVSALALAGIAQQPPRCADDGAVTPAPPAILSLADGT